MKRDTKKRPPLPLLGITMGDPAGIGPEIIVQALAEREVRRLCRPIVIGDARILDRAGRICRSRLRPHPLTSPEEATGGRGTLEVLDLKNIAPAQALFGQISAECGRAAVECVLKAVELARTGAIAGIVTAPLHKEAMQAAGFRYPGHTELIAERVGSADYSMLLIVGRLRVFHISTHLSLREACQQVKKERILQVIRIAQQTLRDLGVRRPRIAVAGLNPHAGEGGLFGREEIEEIAPAVAEAKRMDLPVSGPYPPDALFAAAKRGEWEAIVAMYHDQGHVPLKMIGFEKGVNVTAGLPIVRTSPDHGTAFDIAGKGVANPSSLIAAIRLAARLSSAHA